MHTQRRSREGICGAMNLRCRPREGGDPYAVSLRCSVGGERSKVQWLWVPAFAGTTADSSVPTTVEQVSLARKRESSAKCSEHHLFLWVPLSRGRTAGSYFRGRDERKRRRRI